MTEKCLYPNVNQIFVENAFLLILDVPPGFQMSHNNDIYSSDVGYILDFSQGINRQDSFAVHNHFHLSVAQYVIFKVVTLNPPVRIYAHYNLRSPTVQGIRLTERFGL